MPVRLSEIDASIVKGMLARGDKQQDIAAFFGTNSGRICEINTGKRFPKAEKAPPHVLPPPGPYTPQTGSGGDASLVEAVREVLIDFERRLTQELARAAHDRRQTNQKIDMLMRQQAELRRKLGALEEPVVPRISRRNPLGS